MRADALRLSPFGSRRVPMLLQTEAAECALACLAMVVGAHGHRTDPPTLRQRFSLSLKGATMADLVRMAGELHFNPRALRVEPPISAGLVECDSRGTCSSDYGLFRFTKLRRPVHPLDPQAVFAPTRSRPQA